MITAPAPAKPAVPHRLVPIQVAPMFQLPVAAAAGIGILLPAPAVLAVHHQAHQAVLRLPQPHQEEVAEARVHQDIIGWATMADGVCLTGLVAQAADLQLHLRQLQPRPPLLRLQQPNLPLLLLNQRLPRRRQPNLPLNRLVQQQPNPVPLLRQQVNRHLSQPALNI